MVSILSEVDKTGTSFQIASTQMWFIHGFLVSTIEVAKFLNGIGLVGFLPNDHRIDVILCHDKATEHAVQLDDMRILDGNENCLQILCRF